MSLAAAPVAASTKTQALMLLADGHDLPSDLIAQVEGEEEVAARLHELRQVWTVLHDIPLRPSRGGTEQDRLPHLLVGPPGVFALFPRHVHLGADGPAHDAAALSRTAALASRRLSAATDGHAVPVSPVCVLVCTSWPAPRSDAFVSVLDVDDLIQHLLASQPLHDEEMVSRVAHAAAQEGTWAPVPEQTRACWPSIEASYDATLRVLRRQEELVVPDLVGSGGSGPGSPEAAQPSHQQVSYWTGCRRRRPLRPVGPGPTPSPTEEPEPVEASAGALVTLMLGLLAPIAGLTALAALVLGLATVRRARRRSTVLTATAGALLGMFSLAAFLPAAIYLLVSLEGRWW